MQPSIQYAITSDRVSIAFCTMGQGTPLVVLPWGPWGSIQLEWQLPLCRKWYERLAQRRMIVRYDGRGTGLSDRDATDFRLESQVADRLRLKKLAVLAPQTGGPAAIDYAARHPERVSRLVLWCTYARSADYFGSSRTEAFHALMEKDWSLFTETVAHARSEDIARDAGYNRAALPSDARSAESWMPEQASHMRLLSQQ